MPQIEISIGGRTFDVACQEGEEAFLQKAAGMLDIEASHLTAQAGRMPEAQMLLMAGLMLADKTTTLEDKVATLEAQVEQARTYVETLQSAPAKASVSTDTLAELAARAEALAAQVEGKAG